MCVCFFLFWNQQFKSMFFFGKIMENFRWENIYKPPIQKNFKSKIIIIFKKLPKKALKMVYQYQWYK